MPSPPIAIAEVLRERILRGIRSGTLSQGARLPSARELVAEFNVDSRIILAAYRELVADGLVEIRKRGGVYIRRGADGLTGETLPVKWFADTFAQGLARGISAPDLSQCLRGLVDTVRLSVVVVSSTEDQAAGLARELREDFGVNAQGLPGAALVESGLHDAALKRADMFIATSEHAALATSLAAEFAKPVITIEVRPDVSIAEWALLLKRPVWAVVATVDFEVELRQFLNDVLGIDNLHVLVHPRDDLTAIPPGAPTYVMHRVRESDDVALIRGRILPPTRTISTDSARKLFAFIVRENYRARLGNAPR
jgi:DNA-binding transcriptional regulator YhcF (GntR family)